MSPPSSEKFKVDHSVYIREKASEIEETADNTRAAASNWFTYSLYNCCLVSVNANDDCIL